MARRSPGRPRSAAAEQAILTSTMALLAEVGLHGLTIGAIAARAGVGRPTVYRRWRSLEALVVAALISTVRPLRDLDTGDARRDLWLMLTGLTRDLRGRVGRGVLGVHAAVQAHSPLAQALRDHYLGPRARAFAAVVARGVASGQLRADLEPHLALDLLFGPPIYHLLLTGEPMGTRRLKATFAAVWRALAARPQPVSSSSTREGRRSGRLGR
jgi:AcrR family transcriptional regulator